MTPFTDDDLFFWKNLTGNHGIDEENLEIHPATLKDLLARLEAAEWLAGMAEGPQDAIDKWRKAAGR